jgi:integrase
MARQNLTDSKIRALRPGGKRFDVQDALLPGLIVHVTPRGNKSFMLKRRFPGRSNPTRRYIGDTNVILIAEARDTARIWLAQLQQGVDPALHAEEQRRLAEQQQQQRSANTFSAIVEDYNTRKLSKQRRGQVVAQIFRTELLPHWGAKPLTEITRADVVRLIETINDRPRRSAKLGHSGAHARKVFSSIRAFFNWCIARDIYGLERSPCEHIKAKNLFGPAKTRERVLDDVELQALMRAADGINYPFGDLVKLLVLTGARKSEVADARWAEFDLATRTWTIPAVRFKTGTTHEIPLTGDVIELLNGLYRFKHETSCSARPLAASPSMASARRRPGSIV